MWSKPHDTITYKEIAYYETDQIKEYVQKTHNPPNILILDICLKNDFIKDLDHPNITFINHQQKTKSFVDQFKNAKLLYENFSSNCFYIRKLLKDKSPSLSDQQKKFLLLANDFESQENIFSDSYNLNILFWTEFKNDFPRFINHYKHGFVPFTENQINIINNAKDNAKKLLLKLKYYYGTLLIDGQPKKVLAVISPSFNSVAIDFLMKKFDSHLIFFINTSSEKVSLRQRKTNNMIDLIQFSQKYCEGDGHQHAAGGSLTPLFMELTKKLKPL
jgi:hypothetical protein